MSMIARAAAAALALLAAALPARAEEPPFAPGRPGKNESPVVAPDGRLQVETEIARVGQDGATETASAAATSLRFGLGGGYEAEVIVQPYLRQTAKDAEGRIRSSGAGDTSLRVRKALATGDVAVALIPFVVVPSRSPLGSAHIGGGLLAPVQVQATQRASFAVTPGIAVADAAKAGKRSVQASIAAGLSYSLTPRIGAFAEWWSARAFEGGAKTQSTADFGLTWAAGPQVQLDVGANFGASDAATDREIYLGIARRF